LSWFGGGGGRLRRFKEGLLGGGCLLGGGGGVGRGGFCCGVHDGSLETKCRRRGLQFSAGKCLRRPVRYTIRGRDVSTMGLSQEQYRFCRFGTLFVHVHSIFCSFDNSSSCPLPKPTDTPTPNTIDTTQIPLIQDILPSCPPQPQQLKTSCPHRSSPHPAAFPPAAQSAAPTTPASISMPADKEPQATPREPSDGATRPRRSGRPITESSARRTSGLRRKTG